ncbi:putative ubiquitination network signaling protein acrB [Cladophialophora carrionii]|uniref:Putative ubiquitination network signaling protein acrB n=1 Tax=Cladophialophora carrionii TaxID=86049 RepID=A0A1C1CL52_9EURO|nr:putative ubiquitination network signaling protein acrB [Cladophialophora carrionii]
MPRHPAAKKHQHNNRHENGLVGPGKRVTKQKSNGHLNGTAKGPVPSEPVPQPSPSENSVSAAGSERGSAAASDTQQDSSKPALNLQPVVGDPDSSAAKEKDIKLDANGSSMLHQRRGDMVVSKSKAQDISVLHLASTILRSRPATDTVSLLIVLLALPSVILTIVQALFASLTLMPGGGAGTPTSLLSLLDIFQGSAGVPNFSTIGIVDTIIFGLWICLWGWAQNFALDLAQIQIAITLGNGSSGKNSRVNTFCVAGVLLLHLARSRDVRRFLYSNLVPVDLLSQTGLSEYLKYLPTDHDFGDSPGPPSYIRSLFAIHIIAQGGMASFRRYISSYSTGPAKSKRIDTEASAGSISDASALDGSTPAGVSSSVDYQPPPTPGFKDGKDNKSISAKKRRRQANHVRSKQPFWAALASTKVHVLREVEHNKALPTVAKQEGSPFEATHHDLVSITNVEPSSIMFEATYTYESAQSQDSSRKTDCRPFYVRINGAKWHAVSLDPPVTPSKPDGTARWTGTISGLAPNCTYTCTFIGCTGDEDFASIMVKTPMISDKDLPPSMAPVSGRQPTAPSSPTTTLKNSIATGEAKLSEARNRLTKVKRQHRSTQAKVEKEVESFTARLKIASDDSKQRQKLWQAERTRQQTEDANLELGAALENLVSTPEHDHDDYAAAKATHDEQQKLLSESNEALAKARAAANDDTTCVNQELSTIVARKERLSGRNSKLTEQHDRITHANVEGLNEKERKAAESLARSAEQQKRESELNQEILNLEREVRGAKMRWESNARELDILEKQEMAHRQMMLSNSGPLTPEGELPGTRSLPQHARPYAFGSFQAFPNSPVIPEVQGSPFAAYAKTLPTVDQRRPRSNTNQSAGGISNFSADFEDADPIPPMPTTAEYDMAGRKGSGSSRGKNNGSPAGIIGGTLRSPQRGSYSPGHVPGSTTW